MWHDVKIISLIAVLLILISCGKDDVNHCADVPVVWPLSGTTERTAINDGYGPRLLSGSFDFHRGIDFPAVTGTPIYAVMNGTVVRVEQALPGSEFERLGNFVVISHVAVDGTDVHQSSYYHMNTSSVMLGQSVCAGEQIGTVGNSGVGINTEHLHFGYFVGINSGVLQNEYSRNAFSILPYTHQPYTVELIKNNSDLVLTVTQMASSLDLVRIEIASNDLATVVLDYETREGMDINNEDSNPINNIFQQPASFNQNDTSFTNVMTLLADYTATTSVTVTLKDAKGITYPYLFDSL